MAWPELRPQLTQFPHVPAGQDWYTVLRLPQNIFAICEPRHFQEVISFLIPGDTRALLVDTGMGLHPIRPVVEKLTELPVTVVNTHSHFDHVGSNGEFPFVWAWETADSRRRSTQGWTPPPGDENFVPAVFLDTPPTHYRQPPYTMRPLTDGQRFDLGGRVWEVRHTPGHSDDSIVLFCREERLLCTGDTLYPGTLYAQQTPEIYENTLSALSQCFSDYTLLCSHNEPLGSGGMLPHAAAAFDAMRSGQAPGRRAGEFWLYTWQDVQILSQKFG